MTNTVPTKQEPYIPAGPLEQPPGGFYKDATRREAMSRVLRGVELGTHDERIVTWIIGWDDSTIRTIASLVERAREADAETWPYCTECGAWAGIFLGMSGWHHFRGDPTSGGERTLYDPGHEAAVGWIEPPGRALSPAGLVTLGRALADAVAHRDPGGQCTACEIHPAGLCDEHGDDLDQADAYIGLACELGIGVDR